MGLCCVYLIMNSWASLYVVSYIFTQAMNTRVFTSSYVWHCLWYILKYAFSADNYETIVWHCTYVKYRTVTQKKTCVTCLIYYHTFTFGQFILQGSPNTYQTRITPRAQTSATPSLKSVKQSTQAWNIVAYCFLCPYPENFMNVHLFGIPWCCQPTRTQKIEKGTLCPRG